MATPRAKNLYLAKLAEQAERYDEMVEYMNIVAQSGQRLSTEERNLFSVSYKSAVGARRDSWRVLTSILQKGQKGGGAASTTDGPSSHSDEYNMAFEYRSRIEAEVVDMSNKIMTIVNNNLLPASSGDHEASCMYTKMKADYCRYLAEITSGEQRAQYVDRAAESYATAMATARTHMAPTHPIRLGLSLNYSVFFYEIMEKIEEACALAKDAFDEAISELDSIDEASYKDCTLILQHLRDNLTIWTSEPEE